MERRRSELEAERGEDLRRPRQLRERRGRCIILLYIIYIILSVPARASSAMYNIIRYDLYNTLGTCASFECQCVGTLPYPPCLFAAAAASERVAEVRSRRRASRSAARVAARRCGDSHSLCAASRAESAASSVAAACECAPPALRCSGGASRNCLGSV